MNQDPVGPGSSLLIQLAEPKTLRHSWSLSFTRPHTIHGQVMSCSIFKAVPKFMTSLHFHHVILIKDTTILCSPTLVPLYHLPLLGPPCHLLETRVPQLFLCSESSRGFLSLSHCKSQSHFEEHKTWMDTCLYSPFPSHTSLLCSPKYKQAPKSEC